MHRRFEQTGDRADLEAATVVAQQAVNATSSDHVNLAMHLSTLVIVLLARFWQTGDAADLDAAIDAGREAVTLTPRRHPNLAHYLSSLGGSLRIRFERTGDPADLEAAIDAGQQAVALTPPGHPNLATYRSALAVSLHTRFEQTGDPAELDAAIDAGQQAVAASPPGHPDRTGYLSNLAVSLHTRFEQTRDAADLDAAIDAGQQAVALTPPGHPGLATYRSALGNSLFARFERAGNSADLTAAIGCWQEASKVPTGTPSTRLAAARRWGAVAASAGRVHEAAEGHAVGVSLLPVVAWHGLDRRTRQEQITLWAGLAADAAACAVMDGCPDRAVELLEQGRSVLWAQALNLRSDLTRLAAKDRKLAERLDGIRKVLDGPVPAEALSLQEPAAGSTGATRRARQMEDAVELRRRKAREWDEVLAEVRLMDGFERFLAATPYPELATAAVDGPVVIVNASHHGCHALIVEADSELPRVIDLPHLSLDAAVNRAVAMVEALAGTGDPHRAFPQRERSRRTVLDVLDWLWNVAAEPVLSALGHTSPRRVGDLWPRVWWCPTGPLAILPFHAAGHHPVFRTATASGTDCVPGRVISSYTPTLTALTRARQPLTPAPVRQLTVGMPVTPGYLPLPAVSAEMNILARHFSPGPVNHQLTGPHATRAAVLAAVATHSWAHLACHASQNDVDPDRSGFALWDGALTIGDLAAQPTQRQDLAYLSACETATGSALHLDEAIHLAAGMQFLGYRHVIATMWTIADSPAPRVANTVYTMLTNNGTLDPGRTAVALHNAIGSLRREDSTDPLLWAPYIHIGP